MGEEKYTILTSSGFQCEIDGNALDNLEIFEDLIKMEDPDTNEAEKITAAVRVLKAMIGEEKEKELREHLRAISGKVGVTAYTREYRDMFENLRKNKKK